MDWQIVIKPTPRGIRIQSDSRVGDELAEQLTAFLEDKLVEFGDMLDARQSLSAS